MKRRQFLNKVAGAVGTCGMAGIAGRRSARASDTSEEKVHLKIVDTGVVHEKSTALIAGNCRCANGDVLVAFNSGGDLSAGQRARIVRSTDGGTTWAAPEHSFSSIFQRGGVETGCSLTCLSSGRLLLPYADGFYLHGPPRWGDETWVNNPERFYRHALLFCPTSDDNGKTWQNTQAKCYEGLEAFAFGRVVELPGGTLLLPLWGSYRTQGDWQAGLLKSIDGGKTWNDYRVIARKGATETPILLLPDGRLIALIRDYGNATDRPFHVAYSKDGGHTWSDPERVNINGTSPSLHLMSDGRLLAGYRSMDAGGRCHVASSDDGGKNWSLELELQLPRGEWSKGGYPVLGTLADGRVLVTFHNSSPSWYVAYNILEPR